MGGLGKGEFAESHRNKGIFQSSTRVFGLKMGVVFGKVAKSCKKLQNVAKTCKNFARIAQKLVKNGAKLIQKIALVSRT